MKIDYSVPEEFKPFVMRTKYIVEGDSHNIFGTYAKESISRPKYIKRGIDWEQHGSGFCATITTLEIKDLGKFPLGISIFWNAIGPYKDLVAFWECHSMVSHYQLIRDWLTVVFPRVEHTNEMNFHVCLQRLGISHS